LKETHEEDIFGGINVYSIPFNVFFGNNGELFIFNDGVKFEINMEGGFNGVIVVDFLDDFGGEILEEIVAKSALDEEVYGLCHVGIYYKYI